MSHIDFNLNRVLNSDYSLLDEASVSMDLDICQAFETGAVSFSQLPDRVLDVDAEAVAQFPNINSHHQGRILHASPVEPGTVKPKRVAVLFSGGPAPGGHNVLCGIFDILSSGHQLFGVYGGPGGLLKGDISEIVSMPNILNTGGFNFLGSDRTKIKTEEQIDTVKKVLTDYQMDTLIIIGGDDSNTNAAVLAEALFGVCNVIGVPKTIDGDLQYQDLLQVSFGFDTATKVYSELVGNLLKDSASALKYWHFVKVMGRSASHVALEVALQTQAPITLISEEVRERSLSVDDVVMRMARVIAIRAGRGIPYGVAVIPEGLVEAIPEFLDDIKGRAGLDPHGNIELSQIDSEQVLIDLVREKLHDLQQTPNPLRSGEFAMADDEISRFQTFKFKPNRHFFGYEGRCATPSRFDAMYCYNLGLTAGGLAITDRTGYVVSIRSLMTKWQAIALPLSALLVIEERRGERVPVIPKTLVDIHSASFRYFHDHRNQWAKSNEFKSPGAIQYWGPISEQVPISVALDHSFETLQFKVD